MRLPRTSCASPKRLQAPRPRRGDDRRRCQRRPCTAGRRHRRRDGQVRNRRRPRGSRPGAARRRLRHDRRRRRTGTGDVLQRSPLPHLPPHRQRRRADPVRGVGAVRWTLPIGSERHAGARLGHRNGHDLSNCTRRRTSLHPRAGWPTCLGAIAESHGRVACVRPAGADGGRFSMAAFFATFIVAGWRPGDTFPSGTTLYAASGAAFLAVVLGQKANAWACRSATLPPWQIGWLGNRLLVFTASARCSLRCCAS